MSIWIILFIKPTISSIKGSVPLTTKNTEFQTNTINSPVKKIFDETNSKTNMRCPPKPKPNYVDLLNNDYTFNQYQTIYGCNLNSVKHINSKECQIIIYRCTFQLVLDSNDGGAIYIYLSNDNNIQEKYNIIEKCKFLQCSANNGGAIYISSLLSSFRFDVYDNIFENNQATQNGGAIYFNSVHGSINYCHFINNVCPHHEGCDIAFEFSIPDTKQNEILNVHDNVFEHTFLNDESNSMIYFIHKETVSFFFTDNTVNITNKPHSNFHIFNSHEPNTVFKGIWSFDRLYIPSIESNKEIIKSANFNFNFDEALNNFKTTQRPADLSDFIIFDNEKDRCVCASNEEKKVNVLVLVSKFDSFKQRGEEGGAICIRNCGLECSNTDFIDCASSIGGGAIFFSNSITMYENNLFLSNLHFRQCRAVFGGALYVYSLSKHSNLSIQSCTFELNENLQREGINLYNLHGGSSLFLTARIGSVLNCTFSNNRGDCGSLKIYGNFERNTDERLLIIPLNEKEKDLYISIVNCKFVNETNSKNSIFFVNKIEGSPVNIVNCSFNGTLEEGDFYIDGYLQDKNSTKIFLNSCVFEDETKIVANQNIIDKFWIITGKKILTDLIKKLFIYAFICEAIVCSFFLILKRYETKNQEPLKKQKN